MHDKAMLHLPSPSVVKTEFSIQPHLLCRDGEEQVELHSGDVFPWPGLQGIPFGSPAPPLPEAPSAHSVLPSRPRVLPRWYQSEENLPSKLAVLQPGMGRKLFENIVWFVVCLHSFLTPK